ncbi:ArsR/SmtB family transcription factor [uncultured Sphingomonas sp.]|uniref:ArsR/SmtB family transcription factor n=1 Tax=uncultured Sphingomonas sp. TaxID=158754 RepID=UPI0035CA4349
MSALSQPTRFAVFRKLIDILPEGMASGDIAVAVTAPPTTMSAHLAILSRAGLVSSEKVGRTVIYSALPGPVKELSEFLAHACERADNRQTAQTEDDR